MYSPALVPFLLCICACYTSLFVSNYMKIKSSIHGMNFFFLFLSPSLAQLTVRRKWMSERDDDGWLCAILFSIASFSILSFFLFLRSSRLSFFVSGWWWCLCSNPIPPYPYPLVIIMHSSTATHTKVSHVLAISVGDSWLGLNRTFSEFPCCPCHHHRRHRFSYYATPFPHHSLY